MSKIGFCPTPMSPVSNGIGIFDTKSIRNCFCWSKIYTELLFLFRIYTELQFLTQNR